MGLKALKQALDKREQKKIPTEDLLNMAEFVLKSNFFEFNSNIKQQISGTAIGTKCAPTCACIFVDESERAFLQTQDHQPLLWLRYIENIFFIWIHGEKTLQTYLEKLNKFHPNVKLTHESSKENISFLELNVKLSEEQLETDLYIKPTDWHQYSHYTSSHPERTKRSIVFRQGLRVSRTCIYENDFSKNTMEMKSWFLRRHYPKSLVENELGKVKFSNKVGNKQQNKKGIAFVVTYHSVLKNIDNIIRKNLHLLYMSEEAKKVFTPGPTISFRSARKLSSYLVRAKLYPTEGTVGSY